MPSPFTYEQMREHQRALNAGMLPPEPDAADAVDPTDVPADSSAAPVDTTGSGGVDDAVLNASAIDDSVAAPAPRVTGFDENRAKRRVVLNALRNSTGGVASFAKKIRHAYGVSSQFKASDEEVIQSGFRMSQKRIPDLTPDEYVASMHRLYGDKVDKHLLEQAKTDYPGHKDEASLVNEMYQRKVAREDAGPLTWADKAQIVARRYPELHKSDMEPEAALRLKYGELKKKGKDVGSFEDWLHSQMAPTLAERGYGLTGGVLHSIVEQGKSVGRLGAEVAEPGRLGADVAAATQAGDSRAGEEALARLKESGMGAVNVASLAAAGAAKAGLVGLEGALGAAETAPALSGALEGAVAGGTQGGGQAAVEGKNLGEIAQEAATNAGVGGALGGVLGAVGGKSAASSAAEAEARNAAELEAAKTAGAANLPPEGPAPTLAPAVTDPLELAARHNSETRYASAMKQFAEAHGMDVEDVAKLVASEEPSLTDLAAAQSRHGVTAAEIDELRQAMPEHLRAEVPSAESPVPQAEPASTETPTVSAPSAAATAAPAERGLLQSGVSDRMTEALDRAQGQLAERRAMRRAQLSARLAAAREAYGTVGGGLAGLKAKLSAMAGEMKKPDWEGVADEFKDVDIGQLHDSIAKAPMLEGDKLTAHAGLTRLFNGTKMGAPTLSQIRALRTAFGSDFVEAAVKNRTMMQNFLQRGMRVLNTPRSIMTSLDLSAGMRQGYLMTSRPEYFRAWNTMRRAFGSEAVENDVVDAIKANPKYDIMRQNGLFFQGEKMAGERSETFAGSLVDHWAGIKESQRAYDVFINKLRADVFTNVYDEMASAGIDVADPEFRQSLAHWINTGTGRGSMALLGRDAGLLNALAFSPRLAWSRFETFNPIYYKGLHPAIRVAALKANAKTIAATMSLLGVMAGSGLAKVGWDPRNSDFAKLRFGNTRLDLLGGHQQLGRLFAQMVTGKVVSSTTGREIDLNGSDSKNGWSRQGMTRLDVLSRFMEAKASPLASLAITMMRGKDFAGKPVSIPNEVLTRFTPMPIQDVSDAVRESGWGAGLLAAPAATIGLGVQSYGPSLPSSAGGSRQPEYGVAMEAVNMGQRLWNHLNGVASDRGMKYVTPGLADQWVKDAAAAQVMGHQEATREAHFFDSDFDQQGAIRKATSRRMSRVNKLYKDLAGGNGEEARLAAEKDSLRRRADATGMDVEAIKNPNVYSEVSK